MSAAVGLERIAAADGFPIGATVYRAAGRPSQGSVVIAGAVGVAQQRYTQLATYLARRHWDVVTFDYRGLAASVASAEVFSTITMQQWGELDIEAVLRWARSRLGGRRNVAIAHSIGGQLLGLTRGVASLDAVAMVAVQKGYWALWPSPRRYAILAFFRLAVPLSLRTLGRLPLQLVGLEDLPPGVALDWARWGLHDDFFDVSFRSQAARFADVRVPMLGISVADDLTYAPKATVDWLYERYYSNAPSVRCHIVPAVYGLAKVGHSGFFRAAVAPVTWWDELSTWLATASASNPAAGLTGPEATSLRSAVLRQGLAGEPPLEVALADTAHA